MSRKIVKLYFDTEFTGLTKNTDLISIGIIDPEYNRCFYGETDDYDKSMVDTWIRDNVIKNLLHKNHVDIDEKGYLQNVFCTGSTYQVSRKLYHWLAFYEDMCDIQFVSDVAHYDFVLLVDLITHGKSALYLPTYIVPCVYDINQEIAHYFSNGNELNNVQATDFMMEAFDKSREQLAKDVINLLPNDFSSLSQSIYEIVTGSNKHNSLYDAVIIYLIDKKLKGEI